MSEHQTENVVGAPEKPALLLVDDDPLIVNSLSLVLDSDYELHTAGSRKETRALLQRLPIMPSLALVDLGLPPKPHSHEEGFELINELVALNPDIKILVLSGQGSKTNIQHALTLGAVDFINKPCDIPLLRARLAHQIMMLEAESSERRAVPVGDSLIGESQAVRNLHILIRQFADTAFPVLIQGESGCGKELVAHYVHERSPRQGEPFLSINCAAFSAELLDAQLFGHTKGAFTGATANRAGFFEEAGEGSLFLDEIADLPLQLQSKLLRVLENGEFYRLGETQPRTSRARIIAATNRELIAQVRAGEFRQDLYHRLGVLTINVPPLRERERDCLLMLEHFKQVYRIGNNPFTLDREAEDYLAKYSFPGNVRELRNIVIRLSAKHAGKRVGIAELQNELETAIGPDLAEGAGDQEASLERELTGRAFSLDDTLLEWERRYILAALRLSGNNLSKAARLLGVNRTTLYSRIQRLALNAPE